MWLEQEKFSEINHAVVKGERNGLSRLFSELFHPDNQKYSNKNLTVCPKCQKALVRKMHPYLEYFVQACPDRHGAWMSPEVSDKLKQFVSEEMQVAGQKKKTLQFLGVLGAAIIVLSLITHSPQWQRFSAHSQELKIGDTEWPQRDLSDFPKLAIQEGSISNPEELLYLTQSLRLLETGISNRMNMETVLQTRRSPEKYAKALRVYQRIHEDFLMKWQILPVPETLKTFHSHIESAAQAQMEFYTVFAEAKSRDRAADLSQMLHEPSFKTCNRELLNAIDFIQQHYPQLDSQTRAAIQTRLSWFDVI